MKLINSARSGVFVWSGLIVLLNWANASLAAGGAPVEGFTEPYRTVQVASAESGVLQTLQVKVGDIVSAGQVLATLDDDLQRAQVAIAQQQVDARGRLKAAEAERDLNLNRYEKLAQLLQQGKSTTEETERAKANLEIAEGKLQAEQDEHLLLMLQLERSRIALAKRSILSPQKGTVAQVHRQMGEFVSPAAPQIVTIVELDPLAATFWLSRAQLGALQRQKQCRVQIGDPPQQANGVIDSIAPITEAESGTTAVRIRFANPSGALRGGERCVLELP